MYFNITPRSHKYIYMERVRRQRDTPGPGFRISGSLPSGAYKLRPAASSATQQSLFLFSSKTIWKHERSDGPLTGYGIKPVEDRANLESPALSATSCIMKCRQSRNVDANSPIRQKPDQPDGVSFPKEQFVPCISTTAATATTKKENCTEKHPRSNTIG